MAKSEEYIAHPLIEKDLVRRRAYQENIFINCLNSNSLVVIPTGLGKTVIGLMLAVHRLTNHKGSKVIFLAPTKPLVDQHQKSFQELTTLPEESLIAITGAISPDKRGKIWDNVQVAFMTPQVLQNDIITGLYPLTDISLIIFDECHRAVGDYAYCFIAQKYIQSATHPQILGLTASPGSDQEKINEIKENLFIEHIEIRTEKDQDVIPYIQKVTNEWIKVALPEEFSKILTILNDKLKSIYKYLKEQDLLNSYDTNKVSRTDLLKLNKVINRRIANASTDNERFSMFYAKKLVANAMRISHMTELLETQGINALRMYLEKNLEKVKKNTANKSLRELLADVEMKKVILLTKRMYKQGIVHPKLTILKDFLHEQLIKTPESRILVFCHFRDSVNNVVEYFGGDEIVRAHKFVGQQTKGKDKGLTQKQQIELLEEFKDGLYNVLIGTSVAEEGLDIAECDLVIFYDVVPSAVRSIQRRGRTGRKKEGKVLILMAEGTRDEGYYWAEKAKEKNMSHILNKLKTTIGKKNDTNQPSLMNFLPDQEEEAYNPENFNRDLDDEKVLIVCDHRETASPVVRELSLMNVNVQLEQLVVADYIISDRAGIERKAAQDFKDSLKDGRLFEELKDLKNNFERPILILEGNPFIDTNINENALYGAISSIILNFGITIYRTSDAQETTKFLYHLAKKEQEESKNKINLRFEKAPTKLSYLLEYIISGIPGINSSRAKNLLNQLETLQNITTAEIGDLMKVENIGKKIAQEIYKISRFSYNDGLQKDEEF